jgi:hypothetical protein
MTNPKDRVADVVRQSSETVRCVAETIERERKLGAMGLLWRGALWMVMYLLARWLLSLEIQSVTARVAIAIAPAPVFGWFAWHWLRMVQKMDELERRIQLEALAFAFPITVLWLMTAGLLMAAAPASVLVGAEQLWVMLPLVYSIGVWRAHRQYR